MRNQVISLAVMLSATLALAQVQSDSMAVVAPFVDGQTMAVFRMDLTRIDAAAVAKRWSSLVGAGEPDREMQTKLVAQVTELKSAGATIVYAVFSGEDIYPIVVVPVGAG